TYGQHDGVNQYKMYDAVLHLGVQQREDLNLNGDACAIADNLLTTITASDTHVFKVTDQATVLHQSNGRGMSRNTTGSVACPQVSFGIWLDRGIPCLSEIIKPFFPEMEWVEYQTKYATVRESTESYEDRVRRVAEYLQTHHEPIKGVELQERTKNSDLAKNTWKRTVDEACQLAGFCRVGQTLNPIFEYEP